MRRATLTRLESSEQGTFGTLIVPNGDYNEYFYTGELPWVDNASGKSCIPKGTYQVKKTIWLKYNKPVYLLQDVAGRQGILIHSANFMGSRDNGLKAQLYGCIALGERLGTMDGQKALLVSSPAVRRFQEMMKWEDFTLEVK